MSSPTTLFVLLACALTVLVMLRLLWPLWRGVRLGAASQKQLNATVYRDQLQELERDLSRGLIDAAHYEEARDELQRRLLQDVAAAQADVSAVPAAPSRAGRVTLIALALCVPLAATALYRVVGNVAAIDAPRAAADTTPRARLATLVADLKKNPGKPETWVEVARVFRDVNRFAEAAQAYQRAGDYVRRDPDLLVEHADVLAASANDVLDGPPMALVTQALALNPKHPMALMMNATQAYRQGRFDAAITDWKVLLTALPVGSTEAANVQSNIDQATREAQEGKPGAKPAPADAQPQPKAPQANAATAIRGDLSVAAAALGQVQPDDTVFIIARPNDGSRAPLAVLRKRVSELPVQFTLDDTLAMVPERNISNAAEVIVTARISRSGNAMPQPGDWASEPSAPLKPGAKGLKLVIDHKL
jgi:cytochrome c-type biogenesis protein CcmH